MKKTFFLATAVLAAGALSAQDNYVPKCYTVGNYEVYILVENSGDGNTGILIDAPREVLDECAPDGTYPNATNAVLVCNDSQVWLIDTGFGRNIFRQMAALGFAPGDVDTILLTHMHGDHIGGLFRDGQRAFPNAKVVLSSREYGYWMSETEMNKVPENRRGAFAAAQNVFLEYKSFESVEPVGIDQPIPDGITPVRAYGHTPGHIGFMIKEGKEQLLVWADLTHAMAVQMPHPEISVTYDMDPDMARISRVGILRSIARDEGVSTKAKMPVIGMHIRQTYPGVVYMNGNFGYRFEQLVPAEELY